MRTESGIRYGFRRRRVTNCKGTESLQTTCWVRTNEGTEVTGVTSLHHTDQPSNEISRRVSLKRALNPKNSLLSKAQRAEVWENFRTAKNTPRWGNN